MSIHIALNAAGSTHAAALVGIAVWTGKSGQCCSMVVLQCSIDALPSGI